MYSSNLKFPTVFSIVGSCGIALLCIVLYTITWLLCAFSLVVHRDLLKDTHTGQLSTRIRFRLKTQLFLSVFKKIHTRTGKRRFEKFHFGDRLRKVPFSVTVSSFTCGRKANPSKKSCGQSWHQIHVKSRQQTCFSFFMPPKSFNKPFEFLVYKTNR